jgi:putative component of toxin-antitoxin plasmid stabilization module
VNSGELKLKIEAIRVDDKEGSKVCFFNRKTVILLTMCKAEFLTQACSFF